MAECHAFSQELLFVLWWCRQDGFRQFFIIGSRFSRKTAIISNNSTRGYSCYISSIYRGVIYHSAMPETVSAYRNITYRLLPGSRSNAKQLAGLAAACRFVWNAILAAQSEAYKKAKEAGEKPPSISFFSLGKQFTALRRTVEWLPEYSFGVVRYTL